jgi:hypothetical protein
MKNETEKEWGENLFALISTSELQKIWIVKRWY